MARMTGGEAMVRAVLANGIDTVFGLPGAQIYPLFDAFKRLGAHLVFPRHEQAAAYMAYGAAKSTGRPAAFAVVPGPGILNTATALLTAMGGCAPVIGLTGQVPSEYLGKGRGHLHELPDQPATLRTFIKDALHIAEPAEAPAVINRAFHTARSGRPGPVTAEMCWDTMAKHGEVSLHGRLPAIRNPQLDTDAIQAAARTLAAAKKPMIMCGAGAQHAAEEVQALAERLNAPVTAFRSGRGIVAEDHALGVRSVAARGLYDEVDVLIGIGSRLEMATMRWRDMNRYEQKPVGGPKIIRIDIDPKEMDRLRPDIGVVADAAEACQALLRELETSAAPNPDRPEEIRLAKARADAAVERVQPQVSYLRAIRDVLPRDGYFVPELSQVGFASYFAWPVLAPRTYVTEGFQGTLGFGFPTALGVKVANPDRAVVSVTGDGGFLFGLQELATAAAHQIGLVTLVFNNGAYVNVRRDQQRLFEGRLAGADLRNPDFVGLAESFGVEAHRTGSPQALRPLLERALGQDQPTLIEVVLGNEAEASPWEFIMMPKSLTHPNSTNS